MNRSASLRWPGLLSKKFVILILLIVAATIFVRNAWVCDDAYITMRVVDNFTHGYGLTWNVNERVQVFTHPLWMFFLSGIYWLLKDPYITILALSFLFYLLFFVLLGKCGSFLKIVLLSSVLLVSKAFIDYSSSGLETPLSSFLSATFIYFYLLKDCAAKNRLIATTAAGLLFLNRLDTIIIFAPALVFLWFREKPSLRRMIQLLASFSPLLFWEMFSIAYYGFPLPNTAYAKLNHGIPNSELFAQGLNYLLDSLKRDPVTLPIMLILAVVIMQIKNRKNNIVLLGAFLYLFYIVRIGGDFMSGRFFVVPFICVVCVAAFSALKFSKIHLAFIVILIGYSLFSPFSPIWSGKSYGDPKAWQNNVVARNGIADERAFYYPTTGLFSELSIKDRIEFKTALKIRQSNEHVVYGYATGFFGYYCGPEIYILDRFALSDPFLARMAVDKRNVDPVTKKYWRIGHIMRVIPQGYAESIKTGNNLIKNKPLAHYYEKIRILTRGNVFSWQRIREIIKFNFGIYDYLLKTGS